MKPDTSREASSCEVVSKYFSHSPVMDESSKKIKENQSTKKPKPKQAQKRPRKRPQGQKDIRTLIKKKKNELVSYSKDFELICKQSGIDVDPEQLQLAIALSKSLQDSEATDNSESKSKNLTSNQRKGKIRTTLQEYGFKVPEVKTNSKKVKKYRKQYKLLLVSDNEKQQIIADKYAQILIRNVSLNSTNDNLFKFDNSDSFLYNLTTNVTYECIKNDEIFYIPDLIPKNFNARHNLLRDWSTIPGRPPSPKIDLPNINFSSIECSQEELCEILSGTIETAQSIVKRYHENIITNEIIFEEIKSNTEILDIHTTVEEHKIDNQISNKELFKEELTKINSAESPIKGSGDFDNLTGSKDTEKMALPTNRSCSPDIFDDEVTIILDSSRDIAEQEVVTEKTTVREQNDFMDLTECVNIVNCNNTNFKQNSCLSQGNNKTTINPNDFMELTACVTASSQKIVNDMQIMDNGKDNNNLNIPPLTNVGGNSMTLALKETDIINLVAEKHNIKRMQDIPEDDAVINLVGSPENNVNMHKNSERNSTSEELGCNKNSDTIDLTQALNDDHLPFVPISGCSNTSSVDIISNHDSEEEIEVQNLSGHNMNSPEHIACNYYNAASAEIDLNPNIESNKKPSDCSAFVADYESDNSFDDPINHVPISPNRYPDVSYTEDDNISQKNKNFEEMDLTQSSNSKDSVKNVNETAYDNIDERSVSRNGILDYENDYAFDEPINHVPISPYRCPDENVTENDKISLKSNNLEEMDLTQSSNSEDSIRIVNEIAPKDSDKGTVSRNGLIMDSSIQDDTILMNEEDYCSNNLNKKDLKLCDIIDIVERRSSSNLNENSNHSNMETVKQTIFDCDNDREFDNILENVSSSKQSTSQTSKCYDVDDEVQNRHFDLTQNSDEKISSPKNLEISHDLENQCHEDIYNQEDEIDLIQHFDSEDKNYRQSKELGKRNNISIDYDDCIDTYTKNDCDNILEAPTFGNKEKGNFSKEDVASSSSQISEVFEISDNEFNYSINQHKQDNDSIRLNDTRFDIGGMSIINEFLNRKSSIRKDTLNCSCSNQESNLNESKNQNCFVQDTESNDNILNINENKRKSSAEVDFVKVSTPSKSKSCDKVLFAQTPKHNDYIIKTDQVTPMPKYEMMSSPERNEELDKYGIKPLKRKRAIQILTHIYNQTHPVMEIVSDSETYASPSKIRKKNRTSFPRRAIVTQIDSEIVDNCIELPGPSLQYSEALTQEKSHKGSKKSIPSPTKNQSKKSNQSPTRNPSPEYLSANKENNLYEETKQLPDIRDIECSTEEWVFQKREKAKVHSCRVPLHIAFHNYVSCRRGLREAILRYEPINIDDIHKGLVAIGFRYNPKDLLKFMDKKCITVKTADNVRNKK